MKKAITTAVCLLAAMLTLVGCSCSTNSTAPTEGTQQATAEALDDEKDYSSYKPVKPSKLNDVIDTNKVAPGEGGFHVHIYRDGHEIAKINGFGGWVKNHKGNELLKPSEVAKDVRNEINKLIILIFNRSIGKADR